ncbi:helix-turn-helix transcriptional regulator [Labrys wisconsinensis]|uniref:DNA-binding CsgD family transcriptional regulator n=1 Tax=Labrys wisconsinensis TaxID=425677 RepID=A0ABU0JDE0_9HYPH|nr:LuxR family transcriptional regulator [Labrys wisconsinensis]MDQ0472294.1 DNA-binding CsgD family transcriptional regulator [Labrys wisconsinensis]
METGDFWQLLAAAISAAEAGHHVDRLIDVIGAVVLPDVITVTRYSATRRPEFVKHRGYSDAMVARYLATYYVFDPFYAHWRDERRAGIVPLKSLAGGKVKRGRYIAEFLAQSEICDEIGILLEDGDDCCLGIFLDRTRQAFKDAEIDLLEERFAVFAAVHALHTRKRAPGRLGAATPAAAPVNKPVLTASLWPELSARELELVELILNGHPTATVAARLRITTGTVKNHRARIYEKLDITSERELFLEFFQRSHVQPAP